MNKSVTRRILALCIVIPYVVVAGYLSVVGVLEAFVALGTLAVAVAGFYFGTKTNQT